MDWYYLENGKQAGPVNDTELDRLVASGNVQPGTLVWREGMAGWEPFSSVKAPPVAPPSTVPPLPATDTAACSQCGTVLSRSNLVLLGTDLVCARCKPLYVQKLKEGVPASGSALVYADVGTRFLAKLLDLLIIGGAAALIIGLSAAVSIPAFSRSNKTGGAEIGLVVFMGAVLFVIFGGFFYQIWCLPKFGGTPGKRMLHLRVVTATGGPISWGRAFGRFFAEMLNGMIPFWIGYIIAIFDAEKRTVHDHIAGTRVVRD